MNDKVVVDIVEQPPLVDRFRYKSEQRKTTQPPLPDRHRKMCPAIRVLNYTGAATVLVSCVTTEKPYRQHPNQIIGDDCCKGVCRIEFETNKSNPTVVRFTNISIQCIKKDDIVEVLEERQKLNIDPFKAGFQHKDTIECTAVRLCFQVLLRPFEGAPNGRVKYVPIPPIVSNIVSSKMDLTICDISDTTSPATGKKTIMMFCSKILKSDIKVRLYRENQNRTVEWEAWGQRLKVHRQAAIAFKTPAYASNDIQEPIDVRVQLVRPSDGKRSEPLLFQYLPDLLNIDNSIRKKQRRITESEELFQYFHQLEEEKRNRVKMNMQPNIECNPHFTSGATALPPVTQSNFIPNFSRHGQPHDNHTAQSYPHQQTYFDSRNVQHSHVQHGAQSGQCAQLCDGRSQINFSQPQPHVQPPNIQPLSNFQMQSRDGQFQSDFNPAHSQFQPQHNYSQFQSTNNLQLQTRSSNALRPLPDVKQHLQQQQQHQHSRQSIFSHTPLNNEYGVKNTATPYNPFLSYYNNAEQAYDQPSSNVHHFAAGNNASMVHHGQNLCENNLNAEDIIEKASGNIGPLDI